MSTVITVGDIKISALSDGTSHLPPMFYPGLDFSAHPELLTKGGTYDIPTGCFLIQGADFTILVDAGVGPNNFPFPEELAPVLDEPPAFIAEGGQLPDALAQAGVAPGDVTTVFLTHLHPDHIGWVAPGGTLYFPNAQVVYGEADWDALIAPAPESDPGRVGLEAAKAAGVLRAISEPTVEIAPGVTAHHSPGHTPGHYVIRVSSQGAEAYVLGDAVQHPLQLVDDGISFLTDADAGEALTTREGLFGTLESQGSAVGMQHFPGLNFQKISNDGGRNWTDA